MKKLTKSLWFSMIVAPRLKGGGEMAEAARVCEFKIGETEN